MNEKREGGRTLGVNVVYLVEFNHKINCIGCNQNDLEKLVIIKIDHRSNAYGNNRTDLTDFTLIED